MGIALSDAQLDRRARGEMFARSGIDAMVDEIIEKVNLAGSDNVPNWTMVGPDARKKLKGLIDFYRKKPHPFTSCVRDNTKRFGDNGAKKVCAVLTDLEKGTTKWRKGGNHKVAGMSLEQEFAHASSLLLDDELYTLLMAIADLPGIDEMLAQDPGSAVKKAWSKWNKPPELTGGTVEAVNTDHLIVRVGSKTFKVPFSQARPGFFIFRKATAVASASTSKGA